MIKAAERCAFFGLNSQCPLLLLGAVRQTPGCPLFGKKDLPSAPQGGCQSGAQRKDGFGCSLDG